MSDPIADKLDAIKEDVRILANDLVRYHKGQTHLSTVPTCDLWNLVLWAVNHDKISISKGRELLGVSGSVMRCIVPQGNEVEVRLPE